VTIVLRRLVLPVALLLIWAPAAHAWSWPVQGSVLQPFVYDEAHPYEAGQHRGIDIGADAASESVVAPATGTVSFAGSVPTSGKCVTIQTADGYSVTLTHLGSILVSKGVVVAEGDAVATIGPSGTPEFARPYVHLGIRTTADPEGYLDPLRFLPAIPPSEPAQTVTTPQPSTSSRPAPVAASTSAHSARHRSRGRTARNRAQSDRGRGQTSRPRPMEPAAGRSAERTTSSARAEHARRSSERPTSVSSRSRARVHISLLHRAPAEPTSSLRRSVVEAVSPSRLGRLGAGHEIQLHVPHPRSRFETPLSLVLNSAAALVALVAAVLAARRRRRALPGSRRPGVEILHLPPATVERVRVHQAA
jgi:hypothetical protein